MAASALRRLLPEAPQALQDVLDPALGAVEPPIRSEIFGPQRFAQHGRSLGESHRAARSEKAATFFPRLRDNIRTLRAAYRYIGLQAGTGYDLSPAAEWLLDNFHLIEAQLDRIHEGLPRRYFRALPVLIDPPLAGLPRVYGVAWAFVAHTDSAFDEALLIRFLGAYQETRELDLGEMWALPTTLRVVLVENLRRLAERVASNKAAREVANLCCDRIGDHSDASLEELLALMNARGVGRMFLTQMAQRLQDGRPLTRQVDEPHPAADVPTTSGDHPAHEEPTSDRRDRSAAALAQGGADSGRRWQRADQTADNLSVSNAVSSLRAIADADWSDIIAQTSTLMQVMLRSEVFAAEDSATRDHSLHRIERLSRRSGRSEVEVATALIGLMHADVAAAGDAANIEASHWLRGDGRARLLSSLGLHGQVAHIAPFLLRHLALPAYLAAVLGLTFAWVAAVVGHPLWMALAPGAGIASGIAAPGLAVLTGLAAVLMLFPASEAAIALVHRLISESLGSRLQLPVPLEAPAVPHRLPRRRAAARCQLLRPAGLGVASDEPARHRQGRRAGAPLVGPRAAVLRHRHAGRAAVMVGLDVRVPDAHAHAPRTSRQRTARSRYRSRRRAGGVCTPTGRSVGHLGIGTLRTRPHPGVPVRTAGRAPAGAAPHAA
jgi:cyclic beta-1,2-glucan synthetase